MKIVKVRKDAGYDISEVMLDDGSVYSLKDAISMVENNQIEGV